MTFTYPDDSSGDSSFWTRAVQRIDGNTSMAVYKFYNGLGQLIQTQTKTDVTPILSSIPSMTIPAGR